MPMIATKGITYMNEPNRKQHNERKFFSVPERMLFRLRRHILEDCYLNPPVDALFEFLARLAKIHLDRALVASNGEAIRRADLEE